jgi:hypothetical protein
MSGEQEKTAVVATTRTAFEAEAIAASLREHNVDARVLDTATNIAWGGVQLGAAGGVKVVVLEHELDAAKLALEEIRVESASIDWDAVDLGSDPRVARLANYSRTRRWVWTVVIMLIPAGLFVLAYGVDHSDDIVKILGGTLLGAALVMAAFQLMPERREPPGPAES